MGVLFTHHPKDEGMPSLLRCLNYAVTDPTRPSTPSRATLDAEEEVSKVLVDLHNCPDVVSALRSKGLTVEHRDGGVISVQDLDAVIIGSGPGGSVSSASLTAAGLTRVVVLEKSSFIPASNLSLEEGESLRTMYECAGFLGTEDGMVSVVAGSTLGGGSRINWCASWRTPDHVCKEWAEELGLSDFATEEYQSSLDAVCTRLGVRTGFKHALDNRTLAEGLNKLGAHCEDVPRNCTELDKCSGYCCFGCARGGKQDAVVTYLADAAKAGARVVTGIKAEKVLVVNGRATGVETTTTDGGVRVIFNAPVIISSCGAINTPALLLRSNITAAGMVGNNLRLHPVTAMVGYFDEPIRMWEGAHMSIVSKQVAHFEDGGYGALLFNVSPHPGLLAASTVWRGAHDYRNLLLNMDKCVIVLVLVRDSGAGSVSLDAGGDPLIRYSLSKRDGEYMMEGMRLGCRALMAAGSRRIVTLEGQEYSSAATTSTSTSTTTSIGSFEEFLNALVVPSTLLCAHQMGTAALGRALTPQGEVKGVHGLYVCDSSAFPTSTGVNPMITVYAVSHLLSRGIAQKHVRLKSGTSLQYEQ